MEAVLRMPPSEMNTLNRLLGNLEAGMEALGKRFDRLEERMDERDDTLNDMQTAADGVARDVRYLKDMLTDDVKPVTDDVKRWRMMGLGALGIIGIGGTAFGAGVLWLLNQLGWIKLP